MKRHTARNLVIASAAYLLGVCGIGLLLSGLDWQGVVVYLAAVALSLVVVFIQLRKEGEK